MAGLPEVIADCYRELVGDSTEVSALGCLLSSEGPTATLSVQTAADELKAMLANGAEHIVEDEGAVLEMRWDPAAHRRVDARSLPAALIRSGLSGEDAVNAVMAALEHLVRVGTLAEIAPGAVRAVQVADDPDRDNASDRIALFNNPEAAAEWEQAWDRHLAEREY